MVSGFSRVIMFAATLILLTLCWVPLAWSQSGRRQEPAKAPKPPSGPIAEPSRTSSTNSPPNRSSADEVESNDVVKITSTLVPIPVSVVDSRGVALVNLKLDDFELNVDGQPRPLSDLTRTETPVRLVLLFDNSGSLDNAREFEKHAAMQFFRKVIRSKDEAAVYSIETESYLAQPLTKDLVRLEQTIAMFGKPEG